ncbi:hypothetical protein GCM10009116_20700 [Brevundimonas basaltis]|uniref:Uncharacterized protein n=1 Tax=Brevundimonas basaltis TaxID=472166 RepID=A0A7W8HZG5_9CAUL|nr:hypothetical protein [Brevundimonas basaltis]MBB5291820.1 hypothetical protein [Brevundimonas basaltis]
MIATLLFAAVTAAAPAPADDFKTLCLATKGDVAAVTAATAAQGAWSAPVQQDGLTVWTHTAAGVERNLVVGEQAAPDGKRLACMLTSLPAEPGLTTGIATMLGGVSMAVEANPGLYAYAPDADAYRAGDVTFVQVTSEADSTSLTAIRPVK